MIQGKENKDIKNVVLFVNIKHIESLSGILIPSIVFYGFKFWFYRVKSCKDLYPAVNLCYVYICTADLIRWQIYITR